MKFRCLWIFCLVSKPSEFQNSDAIQFVQIQIFGLEWWLGFMMAGNNMLDSSSLDVLDVCKHEKSSSPRIWKKSFFSSQSFMISLRKRICSNWSYSTLTSRKLTNISSWGLRTHFLHWHWSLLSRVTLWQGGQDYALAGPLCLSSKRECLKEGKLLKEELMLVQTSFVLNINSIVLGT